LVVKKKSLPFASLYWFPLAACFGALMLPWSVAGQFGWAWAPPGLHSAAGHGHEMLFGFALAVVMGYVSGPQPKQKILFQVVVWLGARLSFLFWPTALVASLCNAAFVILLAWQVVPVYLRTAKKWRNKSVAPIILGLALTVIFFHWFFVPVRPSLSRLLLEAVLLLSALMFFMGGRMLAPAIAGHLQTQQRHLKDRVQPWVEGSVLILLAVALLSNILPFEMAHQLAGVVLLVVASLTLVRILRWRIWFCLDRADLLALLAGYTWLVIGWIWIGTSLLSGWPAITLALHAITVGALGTLTLTVMARTRMHRSLKQPDAIAGFYWVVLLIAAAALMRLSLGWLPLQATLLLAAGCWSLAFFCLFCLLLYLMWKERNQRQNRDQGKMVA
jgi:uncharacterized protein involved in response to NO